MSRVSNRTRRKTQMKSRRVRRVRRGSKIRKRKRTKTRKRVKRGGSPTRTNMIGQLSKSVIDSVIDQGSAVIKSSEYGDLYKDQLIKNKKDERGAFLTTILGKHRDNEMRKLSGIHTAKRRSNKLVEIVGRELKENVTESQEAKDRQKSRRQKRRGQITSGIKKQEVKQEQEKEKEKEKEKEEEKEKEGTSSPVLSQNFEQTERAIEVLTNIAEALQTGEFKTQFQSAFPRDLDTEIEQEIQSRGFDVNPGFIKNIFSYFTKGQIDFLLPVNEGLRDETIHCIVTIKGKKQFKFGDSSIAIIHNGAPLASRPTTEVVKSENNAYLVLATCCPHNSGVVKKVRQVEPATLDGLKRITDQLANQASAPPAPLLQEHELPSPGATGATFSYF